MTADKIEQRIAELDAQIAALCYERTNLKHKLGGMRSGAVRRADADQRWKKIKAALRATDGDGCVPNQSRQQLIAHEYGVSVRTVRKVYAEVKAEIRAALEAAAPENVEQFDALLESTMQKYGLNAQSIWNIYVAPYRYRTDRPPLARFIFGNEQPPG